MSKSNASAKNRRAFGGNLPTPQPSAQTNSINYNSNTPQQPSQNQGFTLPQVIAVIDSRLLVLEKFVKETKEQPTKHVQFVQDQTTPTQDQNQNFDHSVNDILAEFSNRFEMIAEEIGSLKDIVLKLQSYTMDVNKTLLEERIHIMSDLGSSSQPIENQLFELSADENLVNSTNSLENTQPEKEPVIQTTIVE